ncbi:hypothetical protein L3Q82_008079 [Scortum barcoo]|uniref:Uncharacterized protein n=1 Tax=Scortum barcoo TaxID=214431 RepID=A0ACB8WKX9_9TELE|nr:hypothetical protein L3Q82_008079 [Scortum barcoo]
MKRTENKNKRKLCNMEQQHSGGEDKDAFGPRMKTERLVNRANPAAKPHIYPGSQRGGTPVGIMQRASFVLRSCLDHIKLIQIYTSLGTGDEFLSSLSLSAQREFAAPPPLLFRKLSNPDLSPAATAVTKSKLHRQLSQDESWARRSSLAMTGKQLLPLSSSLHAGVLYVYMKLNHALMSGLMFGNNAAFIYSRAADKSSVEIKCGSESLQASALVSPVYSPSKKSERSRTNASSARSQPSESPEGITHIFDPP